MEKKFAQVVYHLMKQILKQLNHNKQTIQSLHMVKDNLNIDKSLIKYADSIYKKFISIKYGIKTCTGYSKSDEELLAEKECAEYTMIQQQDLN
jgi:hypothetical protein